MSEEISLSDAVEFIVDNRGKTVPVQESGFPLIATNCVSNENLYPEFRNVRYISDEIYENWFRAHPLPDDILLTNKGSKNGAICLVPDPVSFCIAQDMVALRAKKGVVYSKYLFAILRSNLVQNRIKQLNVDSVIPHFKKTDFNKLFFPLPNYEKQIEIGDTYFNYCQKIELNRQTNQTLEQIAQAIFKSWFVDFEPVKGKIQAKQNGQNPERAAMCAISGKSLDELEQLNPETQQQLKTTAALFSDTLVESELGEIPEGWEVTNLNSIASVIDPHPSHRAPKAIEDGYPFAGIGDIDEQGNIKISKARIIGEEAIIDQENSYTINTHSVGLGRVGTVGKVVKLRPKPFRYALSPTLAILNPLKEEAAEYIYCLLKSPNFQSQIFSNMTGTTRPAIGIKVLRLLKVPLPAEAQQLIIKAFSDAVRSTFQHSDIINEENQTLIGLREALLTKLFSSEIRLDKSQSASEAVA